MKLRHEFSTTSASWHSSAQLCILMEFLLEQTHTAPALWNSTASEHGATEGQRKQNQGLLFAKDIMSCKNLCTLSQTLVPVQNMSELPVQALRSERRH